MLIELESHHMETLLHLLSEIEPDKADTFEDEYPNGAEFHVDKIDIIYWLGEVSTRALPPSIWQTLPRTYVRRWIWLQRYKRLERALERQLVDLI